MSFRFHLIMVIKFYLVLDLKGFAPFLSSSRSIKQDPKWKELMFSLERRWSSRTFRYGYLVTTSPQSPILPSTAASLRLAHRLRVLQAPMVWRAVCTRPGNAFTAAFWSAITSNSGFMISSCRDQSELGSVFWGLLDIAISLLFVPTIVARV